MSPILTQLEEIRSEMAMLKDLKAEVSQIRESMQQPRYTPRQHPIAGGTDGASVPQFSGLQMQDPPQGYWFTPGPRHRGGTAQYQQRFAPQSSFPPSNRGRIRRCFRCQQSGAEDYCMHCYRCGSSEHFLVGCRAREQRQFPLNGERSLTGQGVTSDTVRSLCALWTKGRRGKTEAMCVM